MILEQIGGGQARLLESMDLCHDKNQYRGQSGVLLAFLSASSRIDPTISDHRSPTHTAVTVTGCRLLLLYGKSLLRISWSHGFVGLKNVNGVVYDEDVYQIK